MNVAILSITMVLGMIDILTRCCCVPDSAGERKAGGLPGKCRIDIDGYLIEIVICLMNGNRTNSVASRTWRRSLNSAIKASLVLLVHDKNVYNCATKNKTGHGSTKTVLLTGELLRLADLSFEQPGTRKSSAHNFRRHYTKVH
uniref:(northern house mosquito) hypothetical protein n=2 Tax=Culex pipiens TaxID=7175 RepID=A0A8D8A4X6_CULPI